LRTCNLHEKFTEFYILGPNGTASDYPTELKVGEVIGEKSIELKDNETWERPFTFRAKKEGEHQKLEFLLYKNHFEKSVYLRKRIKEYKEEAHRSLHLWVDVKE